jgi:hypothetical protein
MTDRDAWLNVAQAAQWLAEGRRVEGRAHGTSDAGWIDVSGTAIGISLEYRLKPAPPKPREWHLRWNARDSYWESVPDTCLGAIRVREVLE